MPHVQLRMHTDTQIRIQAIIIAQTWTPAHTRTFPWCRQTVRASLVLQQLWRAAAGATAAQWLVIQHRLCHLALLCPMTRASHTRCGVWLIIDTVYLIMHLVGGTGA